MSKRRSLAASSGRRSAEAQGGVRTPFTGRNFARKAERRSRDRVGLSGNRRSAPDPTKGPSRWKASQAVTSHRSSRFDGHGGLGGFLTVPSTGNHRSRRHGGALTPRTEHARRSVSRGSKRKRRQGCQRLGRIGTVGRQRPRSRSPSGNGKNARLACSPVRELFVSNLDPPKARRAM